MSRFELYHEQEILARTSNGDEAAFHQLYDHYRNKVVTIAFKILHSEAEVLDALQDIFIKIWVNRSKLSQIENFNAYLNTITRNHLSNVLRKRVLEKSAFSEMALSKPAATRDSDDPATLRQLHDMLHGAIHRLPGQQKKVFELSRMHGIKHDDIAHQLHISRETVKRHLTEASRKLKMVLGSYLNVLLPLVLVVFLK